jgi:hypothetical protein
LPGVLILELLGAEIAESGMQSTGIVDGVDEPRKIRGHIGEGRTTVRSLCSRAPVSRGIYDNMKTAVERRSFCSL